MSCRTPVSRLGRYPLKRRVVGLAGADAHRVIEAEYENLSVTDLAGARARGDPLDLSVDLVGHHRELDLDLRHEVHRVLAAAVDLGVALLPAVALDLGDGQAVHADGGERIAHWIELEGLDDGDDGFHAPAFRVA